MAVPPARPPRWDCPLLRVPCSPLLQSFGSSVFMAGSLGIDPGYEGCGHGIRLTHSEPQLVSVPCFRTLFLFLYRRLPDRCDFSEASGNGIVVDFGIFSG